MAFQADESDRTTLGWWFDEQAFHEVEVKRRGATIIAGCQGENFLRLRKISNQWWTPEIRVRSRWEVLPIRATIIETMTEMKSSMPWLFALASPQNFTAE